MTLEQLLSSTKRRLGAAMIGTALSLGALGSQIIPYLDQDAKVTALNASPQTITITATYAPYGHDPRNGTPETLTLAPGQSGTLANPLTQEGSAYVTSTGDDAVLTATTQHSDGSGMDIPVLDANAKNNGQPQAGILANGMQWEKEIVLSGDSTSNNTLNHQAYGPDGTGPTNASPEYVPPGLISPAYVGDIFNGGLPAGSTDILIPQTSDQSKAGGLLLYTNPASGDTRIRTMQNFTQATDTRQYSISLWIQVIDHGQGYAQTTTPSQDIIKTVWQTSSLESLIGTSTYVCNDIPGMTLNKIAHNYNTLLTPEEQQEFSGDAAGFVPFVNDSDNDGSVCDPDETDQQYLNMITLTVTPQ